MLKRKTTSWRSVEDWNIWWKSRKKTFSKILHTKYHTMKLFVLTEIKKFAWHLMYLDAVPQGILLMTF
ncbi:hypothetical protein J437_LFUL018479 [Ladona fulva]|uniref:Uncharacterized protein n=1 Tax=Ladona fulva TaxID=123851 RepID=A0A8K0P5I7_LADFU|nr:hypothetical protein J437_LFUL018479 [Ladona fulva]